MFTFVFILTASILMRYKSRRENVDDKGLYGGCRHVAQVVAVCCVGVDGLFQSTYLHTLQHYVKEKLMTRDCAFIIEELSCRL